MTEIIQDFSLLSALIALYGTYLTAMKDRNGFYFWLASDILFFYININLQLYVQAALFFMYFVCGIIGLIKWK
jgi:hypothetical protein